MQPPDTSATSPSRPRSHDLIGKLLTLIFGGGLIVLGLLATIMVIEMLMAATSERLGTTTTVTLVVRAVVYLLLFGGAARIVYLHATRYRRLSLILLAIGAVFMISPFGLWASFILFLAVLFRG